MSHTLSTETIITIVFGVVASLLAIGAIVATVRATRNHRRDRSGIEGLYAASFIALTTFDAPALPINRYATNY